MPVRPPPPRVSLCFPFILGPTTRDLNKDDTCCLSDARGHTPCPSSFPLQHTFPLISLLFSLSRTGPRSHPVGDQIFASPAIGRQGRSESPALLPPFLPLLLRSVRSLPISMAWPLVYASARGNRLLRLVLPFGRCSFSVQFLPSVVSYISQAVDNLTDP